MVLLMFTMKSPRNSRFLLLLVLIPCILFIVLAEFARDIKKTELLSSPVSGGETSESGETALFVSESFLLCSQPLTRNKTRLNKFGRQFLSLTVFALLPKTFSKVTLRKYHLHHYFPRDFFHILVISLFLSGRAPPPRSV
jgi:hypothetical protein